jgi:hypothetical protein
MDRGADFQSRVAGFAPITGAEGTRKTVCGGAGGLTSSAPLIASKNVSAIF